MNEEIIETDVVTFIHIYITISTSPSKVFLGDKGRGGRGEGEAGKGGEENMRTSLMWEEDIMLMGHFCEAPSVEDNEDHLGKASCDYLPGGTDPPSLPLPPPPGTEVGVFLL